MKNKMIFFEMHLSTGHLDADLGKAWVSSYSMIIPWQIFNLQAVHLYFGKEPGNLLVSLSDVMPGYFKLWMI